MKADTTAVILIGFQNDYFADDGVLRDFLESRKQVAHVLQNTVRLIEALAPTPAHIISTPILFTEDYREIEHPVGILDAIRTCGAFKRNTPGGQTVPQLRRFGQRIVEVPGKRGLNAFSNTALAQVLQQRGIRDVVITGVVTSICVDSTARAAFERGFSVTVLRDCIAGRTAVEQAFYLDNVFPLYSEVLDSTELLTRLEVSWEANPVSATRA